MLNLISKKSHIIGSLYRIKKSSSYLNETFLKNIDTKSFDDIKNLMMNVKNINQTYKLIFSAYRYLINTSPIKHIKRPYNSHARIFLSHIIIFNSPDSLLGPEKTRTLKTRKLHRECIMLINYFKILSKNPSNKKIILLFLEHFNSYMTTFLDWQKADKEKLIGEMAHNYWELEITKRNVEISNQNKEMVGVSPPNDNRQEIIDSLKKMQKDILTNIQRLDTESMDTFNQYIPIIYTEDFIENVRDTLEIVFWDNIRNDMALIPPNNCRFKAVLQELLDNLRTICIHDETYQNNLTEFYDIELLLQMIQSRVYTFDNLKSHFNALIDILIRFDAPINDSHNLDIKNKIIQRINELEQNPLKYYSNIIECWIEILKNLLPAFIKINKIKNELLNNNN